MPLPIPLPASPQIETHDLAPTNLMPNSPYPLLHYRSLLNPPPSPSNIHSLFAENGWETHWIFRYGETQRAHYHSTLHECMVVLTGTARIRFGAGDVVEDLEANTYGSSQHDGGTGDGERRRKKKRKGWEEGGIEVDASSGDVFILPAGLAHKTFETRPAAEFRLLTPGEGRGVVADDVHAALDQIRLDGFTMMGAYPVVHDGRKWDFAVGGEDVGSFEKVWNVPKPERDPVLGGDGRGLCGLW